MIGLWVMSLLGLNLIFRGKAKSRDITRVHLKINRRPTFRHKFNFLILYFIKYTCSLMLIVLYHNV